MYNADIDNCLYIIFGINLKKASITDKKLVSETSTRERKKKNKKRIT